MKLLKLLSIVFFGSHIFHGTAFADNDRLRFQISETKQQLNRLREQADMIYENLLQMEASLEQSPQETEFSDVQTVQQVLNIECVANSPKASVRNAVSTASSNARARCVAVHRSRNCGEPILEFRSGTGTASFTCQVKATVLGR